MPRYIVRSIFIFTIFAAIIGTYACTTIAYYTQSVGGHLDIMVKRRPVDKLTADPDTPEDLRRWLTKSQRILRFATQELGLPDNGSYRSYANLNRQFVIWNVFATPEFSLEPLYWCFPFVGCFSYRGYFVEEQAQRFANKLRAQGNDVFVHGIIAYSTLGWFADPILNTMLRWGEIQLAKTIFHELAHQKLYIANETAFNEAFATKVAQVGVQRWLEAEGALAELAEFRQREKRDSEFVELVLNTRKQLESLYASPLSAEQMRKAKARIFEALRYAYKSLKSKWNGYKGYDEWMATELNNAKISSVVTYHQYVRAFDALLEAALGDLNRFYEMARRLGQLPRPQRLVCLDGLMHHGASFVRACFESRSLAENILSD